jgi:hypothetical protein
MGALRRGVKTAVPHSAVNQHPQHRRVGHLDLKLCVYGCHEPIKISSLLFAQGRVSRRAALACPRASHGAHHALDHRARANRSFLLQITPALLHQANESGTGGCVNTRRPLANACANRRWLT